MTSLAYDIGLCLAHFLYLSAIKQDRREANEPKLLWRREERSPWRKERSGHSIRKVQLPVKLDGAMAKMVCQEQKDERAYSTPFPTRPKKPIYDRENASMRHDNSNRKALEVSDTVQIAYLRRVSVGVGVFLGRYVAPESSSEGDERKARRAFTLPIAARVSRPNQVTMRYRVFIAIYSGSYRCESWFLGSFR